MRIPFPLRWAGTVALVILLALVLARITSPGVRVTRIGEIYDVRPAGDSGRVWLNLFADDDVIASADGVPICERVGSVPSALSRGGGHATRIVTTAYRETRISVIDVDACENTHLEYSVRLRPLEMALTASGDRVAMALGESSYSGTEGGLAVYDAAGGGEVFERWGLSAPSAVEFSPDGALVAVGGRDATVAVVDASHGDLLWQRALRDVLFAPKTQSPYRRSWARRLVFSADGRYLAVGFDSDLVVVLDPVSGEVVQLLEPELPRTTGPMAFHPERPVLAVALSGGGVVLWDVVSGEALGRRSMEGALLRSFRPGLFLHYRVGRVSSGWRSGDTRAIAFADGGEAIVAVDTRRMFRWPSGL